MSARRSLLFLLACALSLTSSVNAQVHLRLTPICAGCTMIWPGDDWQTKVTAGAAGDTFYIRAGTHYNQTVSAPKNNQTFRGEPGAIMSGGRVLTGATGTGPWAYSGQTQAGTITPGYGPEGSPYCFEDPWLCRFPEDVFIDDVLQERVETLNDVTVGQPEFFFDYTADIIYIGTNPSGHTVTTSVTPYAFSGSNGATGVTIRDLTIEKYANPATVYTIDAVDASGWSIINNEFKHHHYSPIRIRDNGLVRGNYLHHNGAFGMNGAGANIIIEDNHLSYNNVAADPARFSIGNGAGGTKFVFNTNLIIRRNFSHHNGGPGLWCDINCNDTIYEYNTVEDNESNGIFHEVSYKAIIRYNIGNRNGTLMIFPGYVEGACILVSGSRNVEVHDNTCTDNYQGIAGLAPDRGGDVLENDGTWELIGFDVHDNTVTQTADYGTNGDYGLSGVVAIGDEIATAFTMGANNLFTNNTYVFNSEDLKFNWNGGAMAKAAWMTAGHDTTGSFTP